MEPNDWRNGPNIGQHDQCPWRKRIVYEDEDQAPMVDEARLPYTVRGWDEVYGKGENARNVRGMNAETGGNA